MEIYLNQVALHRQKCDKVLTISWAYNVAYASLTNAHRYEENDVGDHLAEDILQVSFSATVAILKKPCAPQN